MNTKIADPLSGSAISFETQKLGFGCWGPVDFRRAGSMAEPLRLIQELVVSAVAALAWHITGATILGSMMALLPLVHHALVYLSGGTLLKNMVRRSSSTLLQIRCLLVLPMSKQKKEALSRNITTGSGVIQM